MIDLTCEKVLELTEAAKAVPKIGGRRPDVSTVWRWCRRGVRGVRLDYVKIRGRICTSREALNRFFNALAAADRPLPDRTRSAPTPADRSAAERQQAVASAKSDLAAAGV